MIFQQSPYLSPLLPLVLDEVHALWLLLDVVVTLLDVAWKLSVSCVVNVLGWEESIWLVVLVELFMGKVNVVLNTIAIGIINIPGFVWSELKQVIFS